MEDLEKSILELNPQLDGVDMSCFNGVYVSGKVTPSYLSDLENSRSTKKTKPSKPTSNMIGIHNGKK